MPDQPVVNISVITPKPECFAEFMELQLAQHHAVRGKVDGLIGGACSVPAKIATSSW